MVQMFLFLLGSLLKKKLLMQKVFNFLVRITCTCTVGISLTASELTEKKLLSHLMWEKINKECYKGS